MAYRFDLDAARRRDDRIADLEARAELTDAELDELACLIANRDQQWRRLPHRITAARRTLDALLTYAADHGVQPKEERA